MQNHTRRTIAYIVGRLISDDASATVYDYSSFKHFSFGGDVSLSQITIFDYDKQCQISGLGSLDSINLYHFGNRNHIFLNIEETHFNGFDYDTNSHFSGDVMGKSVSIFDYEHNAYFNYSI